MAAARSTPPAERRPTGRFEWERLVRRAVIPWRIKGFALLLSTYADPDGSRVRPGQDALAAITERSDRTVRRMLDELDDLGLIELVMRGGGRGHSKRTTVYRLTIPADLLDRFELLSPAERPYRSPDTQVSGQSGQDHGHVTEPPDTQVSGHCGQLPVDNSETPDTQVSAQSDEHAPIDRTLGDTFARLTGHSEPIDRTPGCPTTTHYQPPTEDHPTDPDPAQPQTARDDTGSQKDHDDEDEPAAAEPPPKCPHNLPRRRRPDGQPGCAFCRRDATKGPP